MPFVYKFNQLIILPTIKEKENTMKEPLYNVSRQIKDLIDRNGGITLFELEQNLDASYNLIFLAIDSMVTSNEISLKRCGKDYFISNVSAKGKLPVEDAYRNEFLCQDV